MGSKEHDSKKVADLKAHELKVGDRVWFSEGSKGQKHTKFKPCLVKEMYEHHIVVEVLTNMLNERATKKYNVSLGKTSINCGDIAVRRNVKQSEIAQHEDLVAE